MMMIDPSSSARHRGSFLPKIPADILPIIFQHLDIKDILRFELAIFHHPILHENWKKIVKRIISPDYHCETVLSTSDAGTDEVTCMQLLTNGKLVAGFENGIIQIWNLETLTCDLTWSTGSEIHCLAVLSDGRFVSGCNNGVVSIWSSITGECERLYSELNEEVWSFVNANDDLLIVRYESSLFLWDLISNTKTVLCRGSLTNALLLPDRKLVLIETRGLLRIMNLETNQNEVEWEISSPTVHYMRVVSNGKLATISLGTLIQLWDLTTGKAEGYLEVKHQPRCAAHFLSNDRFALFSNAGLSLYNLLTLECLWRAPASLARKVLELADGRLAVDYSLNIWDLEKARQERELLDHDDLIKAILQLPDGRIVTAAEDETIRIWKECDAAAVNRSDIVVDILYANLSNSTVI